MKAYNLLVISLTALGCVGCGRAGAPRPPEDFAPQAVAELKVEPGIEGVRFSWSSPRSDQRGKELASLGGYKIYRREASANDPADSKEYQVLSTIADTSVEKLQALKAEALASGKPTRGISVDKQLQAFSYLDSSVQPGGSYLYKIIPFNQDDIEGRTSGIVKVDFRGEGSPVTLISATEFEEIDG